MMTSMEMDSVIKSSNQSPGFTGEFHQTHPQNRRVGNTSKPILRVQDYPASSQVPRLIIRGPGFKAYCQKDVADFYNRFWESGNHCYPTGGMTGAVTTRIKLWL